MHRVLQSFLLTAFAAAGPVASGQAPVQSAQAAARSAQAAAQSAQAAGRTLAQASGATALTGNAPALLVSDQTFAETVAPTAAQVPAGDAPPVSYSIQDYSLHDHSLAPEIAGTSSPSKSIWEVDGTNLGIDVLLWDRQGVIPYGEQIGGQLSIESFALNGPGTGNTIQLIGRFVGGEYDEQWTERYTRYNAETESSLFDLQANYIWETFRPSHQFGFGIGARIMKQFDSVKVAISSRPTVYAESDNLMGGPQAKAHWEYFLGDVFIGASGGLGVMYNSSERRVVGQNSGTLTAGEIIPVAEIDLETGIRLGPATEVAVGVQYLWMEGVVSTNHPDVWETNDRPGVGYGGLRIALTNRF